MDNALDEQERRRATGNKPSAVSARRLIDLPVDTFTLCKITTNFSLLIFRRLLYGRKSIKSNACFPQTSSLYSFVKKNCDKDKTNCLHNIFSFTLWHFNRLFTYTSCLPFHLLIFLQLKLLFVISTHQRNKYSISSQNKHHSNQSGTLCKAFDKEIC